MANILDYISWRGDLSFSKDSFNKLDALIFSQMTLMDLENVIPSDLEGIRLEDAFSKYLAMGHKVEDNIGYVISNNIHYMFEAMAKANRYKNLRLFGYQKVFDEASPVQFSAFTIEINKTFHAVSYGGTDDSLAGWQEDLEMIYQPNIGCQILACEYLEKLLANVEGEVALCGHSKGGNIAMYAVLNISDELLPRVKKVYNFDGPGFAQNAYTEKEYHKNWKKIVGYLPCKSSVGRMLYHHEKYKVLKSDADLVFQHDVFTWHVMGSNFVYVDNLGDESIYLDIRFKTLISSMTEEEQKFFVASLFKFFYSFNAKSLTELAKNKILFIPSLMKLTKEERAIVNRIFIKGFLGDPKIKKMLRNILFKKNDFRLANEEKEMLLEEVDKDEKIMGDE